MKQLSRDSVEFNRVLSNLRLEDMQLSEPMQDKVLNILNSDTEITTEVIKEALISGEI